MLSNIFKEKVKSILFTIVGLILVVIVTIWFSSNRVSANVWPISVSVSHIDFGTVFPGETLQENFIVNYATTGDGVYYRIIQRNKPLPGAEPPQWYNGSIEEYCQEYPDDLSRCYRDLCPFLDKVKVEQDVIEDTESEAFVGPNDISDTWTIYFQVPAIFGNVSQDHIGGVITEGGEYGCDVSIEIID